MVKNLLLIVLAVALICLGIYNGLQFETEATYPEKVALKMVEDKKVSPELAGWVKALAKQKEYYHEDRDDMRKANMLVVFPVAALLLIIGLQPLTKRRRKKK